MRVHLQPRMVGLVTWWGPPAAGGATRALAGFLFLTCLSGCNSSQPGVSTGASTSGRCDPLAPHELPVTLGTVLGVGKDTGGTVYLADHVPEKSIDRVFVSTGTELGRKRVSGSGTSGGGANADYTFSFDEGDGAQGRALLIQRRSGAVTAMGLGPGGKAFIGAPGATDETLTVLGDRVPSGYTLRNLPGEVTIEYVADIDDGNGSVLVVTRPTDDSDYTDFRVFVGHEARMLEGHVENVTRTLSGSTSIRFLSGTETVDVSFTFETEFTDAGLSGHPGPGTFVTGGGSPVPLTQRVPTPTSLPGFSFSCL
jgi:hypothetical protein